MPYGITQCYLPLGNSDLPAFTTAKAGTRFSDRGGMQGWVDLDFQNVLIICAKYYEHLTMFHETTTPQS